VAIGVVPIASMVPVHIVRASMPADTIAVIAEILPLQVFLEVECLHHREEETVVIVM
jgi:hypothetical protein